MALLTLTTLAFFTWELSVLTDFSTFGLGVSDREGEIDLGALAGGMELLMLLLSELRLDEVALVTVACTDADVTELTLVEWPTVNAVGPLVGGHYRGLLAGVELTYLIRSHYYRKMVSMLRIIDRLELLTSLARASSMVSLFSGLSSSIPNKQVLPRNSFSG